jgi:hypothetical protein
MQLLIKNHRNFLNCMENIYRESYLLRSKEQNIGKDGSKDGAKVTDLKFI